MSDHVPASPAPAAPVAAPTPASPVAVETVAAPVAVETAPVEAAPTPAAEPTAVVETPTPEAAPAAEPSLITDPAPVTVAPVAYEPFVVPDGVTVDQGALTPFTEILGQHQVPQAAAQALFDRYVQTQQDQAKAAHAAQVAAWEGLRSARHKEFDSDPDMGGNRRDTTLATVRDALDRFGGTADQVKALKAELVASGASELPGLVRLINNMASRLQEGRPVAATMAKGPSSRSTPNSRYGNSPNMPRSN